MSTVLQRAATYDISELWVAQVLTDCGPLDPTAPNEYTINPLVNVPGVRSLALTWEMITDELRGDGQIKERVGYLDKINGSVASCFSPDVMAEIFGAEVETTGVGAAQVVVNHFTGGAGNCLNDFPYFYLEASSCLRGGDVHPAIWKCQVTGAALNYNEQSFAEFTFEFAAIPTDAEFTAPSTNDIPLLMSIWQNATAVPVTDPSDLGLFT